MKNSEMTSNSIYPPFYLLNMLTLVLLCVCLFVCIFLCAWRCRPLWRVYVSRLFRHPIRGLLSALLLCSPTMLCCTSTSQSRTTASWTATYCSSVVCTRTHSHMQVIRNKVYALNLLFHSFSNTYISSPTAFEHTKFHT